MHTPGDSLRYLMASDAAGDVIDILSDEGNPRAIERAITILETLRRTIFQPKHIQMGFRNVDANGIICHLRHVLCLSCVICHTRIRSGPLVKTAADQTLERSITTQPLAIQPPPLPVINDVPGSGSRIPQEPGSG